eukprot:CAMPEP_0201614216 /NCGR_PEP_ID=MMETSP0492-20130828/28176_1 /ASSEMBLY_ACC=CAM_ASM_000837 /TAXON_ID=420259 /ORGANISM="Thalassiosira gravida, Strain GMp14c1" /LENGTH=202 /DNA_ID=CAMNT_0048081423 /DNA_START=299 /DNA_END=907 /DNA_ORIENTATION=-
MDEGDCAWIWSPITISDELAEEVESKAGPIKFIVSPNKIHHLFLKSWVNRYPDAVVYAPPGLEQRMVAADIRFDARFGEGETAPEFAKEIDSVIIAGSYFMEEVEFYHKPSKTAILCDLIQRHEEANMTGFKGLLMKMGGVVGEHGSTPRDWRFTFWPFGKTELRKARDAIFDWNAEKLIIAHGQCVDTGASEVIKNALHWI